MNIINVLTSCPTEIQHVIWKTYMTKHVLSELRYRAAEHQCHYTSFPFLINDYDPIIDYIYKLRAIYVRKLINYDINNMFYHYNMLHDNRHDSPIVLLIRQFKQDTNPNKHHTWMINVEKEYFKTRKHIMRISYF